MDVGTVLDGDGAVECGLTRIDELGGFVKCPLNFNKTIEMENAECSGQ